MMKQPIVFIWCVLALGVGLTPWSAQANRLQTLTIRGNLTLRGYHLTPENSTFCAIVLGARGQRGVLSTVDSKLPFTTRRLLSAIEEISAGMRRVTGYGIPKKYFAVGLANETRKAFQERRKPSIEVALVGSAETNRLYQDGYTPTHAAALALADIHRANAYQDVTQPTQFARIVGRFALQHGNGVSNLGDPNVLKRAIDEAVSQLGGIRLRIWARPLLYVDLEDPFGKLDNRPGQARQFEFMAEGFNETLRKTVAVYFVSSFPHYEGGPSTDSERRHWGSRPDGHYISGPADLWYLDPSQLDRALQRL